MTETERSLDSGRAEKGEARPDGPGSREPSPDGLGPSGFDPSRDQCHGLDTPERVCFYEQDFYVLSNFSSFQITWYVGLFATSEHLYHWERFQLDDESYPSHDDVPEWRRRVAELLAERVRGARSAHDAFRLAQEGKAFQRPDWEDVKVGVMRRILKTKADQHEYVRRKLLATGKRELVENSWRDGFWGWGANRDGQNMLGKLWMEVRDELRAQGGNA